MDMQYKFLKKLCTMFDGENYVLEADVRKKWKRCPSHYAILNMGKDVYFEYNLDMENPGYMPTPEGIALVQARKQTTLSIVLGVVTLAVAVLTLVATLAQPLFQH